MGHPGLFLLENHCSGAAPGVITESLPVWFDYGCVRPRHQTPVLLCGLFDLIMGVFVRGIKHQLVLLCGLFDLIMGVFVRGIKHQSCCVCCLIWLWVCSSAASNTILVVCAVWFDYGCVRPRHQTPVLLCVLFDLIMGVFVRGIKHQSCCVCCLSWLWVCSSAASNTSLVVCAVWFDYGCVRPRHQTPVLLCGLFDLIMGVFVRGIKHQSCCVGCLIWLWVCSSAASNTSLVVWAVWFDYGCVRPRHQTPVLLCGLFDLIMGVFVRGIKHQSCCVCCLIWLWVCSSAASNTSLVVWAVWFDYGCVRPRHQTPVLLCGLFDLIMGVFVRGIKHQSCCVGCLIWLWVCSSAASNTSLVVWAVWFDYGCVRPRHQTPGLLCGLFDLIMGVFVRGIKHQSCCVGCLIWLWVCSSAASNTAASVLLCGLFDLIMGVFVRGIKHQSCCVGCLIWLWVCSSAASNTSLVVCAVWFDYGCVRPRHQTPILLCVLFAYNLFWSSRPYHKWQNISSKKVATQWRNDE